MTTPSPDRLIAAHEAARAFYRYALLHADGPPRYLTDRGFAHVARVDVPWHVGYAPSGWTNLTDHLTRLGYTPDELLASGLARAIRGGRLVDAFRDRIMLPIHGPDGRPVAYTGRAAPAAGPTVPKYLNTRATAIYHKGQTLYGLAEQTNRFAAGWAPVLVEGPLDVLAIWLAHAEQAALATGGTVLTASQAAIVLGLPGVARHGVTTCFDHDDAGQAATVRAWRLLPTGIDRYAATLPAGTDPADYAPGRLATLSTALGERKRPLTEAVLDIHLDRLLARHADLLDHVDGRVQAARALASLLVDQPSTHVAGLVRHVAVRTHVSDSTALGLVTEARETPPDTRKRP